MEVAMKLLEKDSHEKQDTLAALRLQLEQVKTLNLQMFHKAQVDTDDWTVSERRSAGCYNFCSPLKESERQAEKKEAEALQLEQRMKDMEKAMEELEQRYPNVHEYSEFIIFLLKSTLLLIF